ncbi:MAG: glycosyltransferase family 9 protein [Candidatus Eremiobacteraeota bacterium]|nr:glycosyltransferase family 9 protein [Candidatus Eremiobacteraeota bacterium]
MHILLSRTDRIGDLILSTPAIATVRASFPDARVTIVTSAYNRVAVERNPNLDEVRSIRNSERPSTLGSEFRGKVDLAIALAPRAADFAIVGATRAPIRIGYTYVRRYFARLTGRMYLTDLALSQADPLLVDRNPLRPVRHEVEELLDLVARAGATRRVDDLRIDIVDRDRHAVAHLPANSLTFHLADHWLRDGSTLENTIGLLRELHRFGLPVVVTHAAEHRAQAAVISRANVVDAVVGDLTFFEWAAAFERARCVVTVDTAATHVASAMRKPTVVAFEDRFFHLSSQEWAPYRVPHAIVRKPAHETPAELDRLRADIVAGVAGVLQRVHA